MAERLTSPEEAEEMKTAIRKCIDDLERDGFTRGQIAAAMAGISLGVARAHLGRDLALSVWIGARNAMEAADATVN